MRSEAHHRRRRAHFARALRRRASRCCARTRAATRTSRTSSRAPGSRARNAVCRSSIGPGWMPKPPRDSSRCRDSAEGDVGRAIANGREADALAIAREWQQLFGDRYYLELQRLGRPDDETQVAAAVRISQATSIPVVATNDVRFLSRDDFESHEARVCIAEGTQLTDPSRPRRYSEAQYLRTPAEMAALFADIPEALENTVAIARRCSLPLKLGESRLPVYPLPEGVTVESFIREESLKGFAAREKAFDPIATRAHRGISAAPRERARGHRQDGLRGLLPDRRGLHSLGARQRRARRSGPRLGCGLAGRVLASASRTSIR